MSEGKMIKMDKHTSELVAEGMAAWGRVKSQESWQDWLRIGRAIDVGRIAMMSYLHTNNPIGRVWADNWGKWLKETGFDTIDKGTRSRLQNCIENLGRVEEWRQSIGLAAALKLTHPDSVWKKFQAATKPKVEQEKGEKIKAKDNLTMAVERIEAVSDKIESEPQFMLDLSDVESAAQTFLDYHGDELAKKFADMVSFLLLEKVAPEIAHRVIGEQEVSDVQIFHANAHGHDDHAEGKSQHDNPYQDRVRRQAWLDGWNSAQTEAEAEIRRNQGWDKPAKAEPKKRGRPAKALTGIAAARQAEKKLAAKTGRRPRA